MQYIQYKYTFFHKVVCRLIVLTCSYLMVCIRTVEDARCETKTQDALMPQKWSIQSEVLLSLKKQLGEHSE